MSTAPDGTGVAHHASTRLPTRRDSTVPAVDVATQDQDHANPEASTATTSSKKLEKAALVVLANALITESTMLVTTWTGANPLLALVVKRSGSRNTPVDGP